MKRVLNKVLLSAALFGLHFMSTNAVMDWVPVGDNVQTVNSDQWAYTGATYEHKDLISSDIGTVINPGQLYNKPFDATGSDNVLNIYGTLYTNAPSLGGTQVAGALPVPLKIDKDVLVEALVSNMTINIQEAVTIEPYFASPTADESGASQIYFNADVGRKITVNVNNDVIFKGKTVTTGETTGFQDLIISFKGRGQVDFKMADGTKIEFTGDVDKSNGITLDPNSCLLTNWQTFTSDAGGTKVFVLMDQTVADVANNLHKVVFERLNYASESLRTLVYVGPNSVITYLSDNKTGIQTGFDDGYGSIAFDPSNPGTGRMVLFIAGAYDTDHNQFLPTEGEVQTPNPAFQQITKKYPFNDGAVLIVGHFVPDFSPGTISGSTAGGETVGAPGYDFSTPAGIQAIFRVTDDLAFNNIGGNPYAPSTTDRRGLLVVNDTQNHGKLASDVYWDLYLTSAGGFLGVDFANSNPANALRNVRFGFLVGVNGQLDIYHNCFLDHAGGSVNQQDPLAEFDADIDPTIADTLIKKRNPSAVIVDGLDPALFISGNPFLANATSEFIAANPFTQVHPTAAEVMLRGNGTVYFKSSTDSQNGIHYGYLFNFWNSGPDPLNDTSLDYTAVLASTGVSTYNGFNLSPTAQTNQSGEGQHVLDVEGLVRVTSVANNTIAARNYFPLVQDSGVLTMASVLRDYRGFEAFSDGSPVTRPLLADGTQYTRYNSPAMFFNNAMYLFGSILRHSDATKFVDGIPNFSEPAMTGGERLFFAVNFWGTDPSVTASDPDRYRFPEVRFYDSTFEIQESCNVSGVRFVVTDLGITSPTGDNTSVFKFYDHGDQLDTALTGFGRVLMFGSSLNLMADSCTIDGLTKDATSNWATESAYLNVFRHSLVPEYEGVASAVTLSLQNGDQFLPDVPTNLYELQRAQHLFLFSQPGAEFAATNMRIGWPTIVGDASPFPSSYPYPFPAGVPYPSEVMSTNPADLFTLDALIATPAVVSIDGQFICWGSFNCAGKGTTIPVATGTDSGIVYVDHGGKLTITRPETLVVPNDRSSKPYRTVVATTICQKTWNDYDLDGTARVIRLTGDVDLPHDQSIFDATYNIQPYGFTLAMFDARRAETDGYVRVSFDNGDVRYPLVDTRPLRNDRSGAQIATFGWFYRDFDLANFIPVKGLKENPKKAAKLASVKSGIKAWLRATEVQKTVVKRPVDLLYIGAGDDITQLGVAGATMADPFELDVSGDGVSPLVARVREFVSEKTTTGIAYDHFIGEGQHAVLFGEFNGRIGLGSRAWNERSLFAWNLLGKDWVSICPLGNMTVDVNSNLIVTDRGAFIACENFGREFTPTNTNAPFSPEAPGFYGEDQQATFISSDVVELRVPANGELDFTAFGRTLPKRNEVTNQPTGPNAMQKISFAGNVRVILEEGATLRLPDNPSLLPDGSPAFILYFNDDSQLIFEGAKDSTPFLRFADSAATQFSRIKIVGKGQIWLNKDAKFIVNGNTFVAVQSDEIQPQTDVTISIQRQGQLYIGTETLSGGSFEVGNPFDMTLSNTMGTVHDIKFNLLLNGAKALVHIDREGFFGLGAGVVNKNGNPNGGALAVDPANPLNNNPVLDANGNAAVDVNGFPIFNPDSSYDQATGDFTQAWEVQALHNVSHVNIDITQGIFEHKNIGDGSSSNASLMAIGPVTPNLLGGKGFRFALNGRFDAFVRGGGNLMFVPETSSIGEVPVSTLFVNVWDYAGALPLGEAYSVLASAPLLLDRRAAEFAGATLVPFGDGGGKEFNGNQNDTFNFLASNPFALQGQKKIDISSTQFAVSATYVDITSAKYATVTADTGSRIDRFDDPVFTGGDIYDALVTGALNASASVTGPRANIPTNFTVIR